jgi:ribose transport system substrate-binding protein
MGSHHRFVGSVAVSAALLVASTACQQSAQVKSDRSNKPAVAFVLANTSLNFAMEMAAGYGAGVRQVGGVDFSIVGPPRNDNAGQAKLFEDLITTGKADGGIALFQQAADIFAPAIAKAHAENIPMIAVDNRTDATAKIDLFVGNDNYALGRQLADEVAQRLPAGAKGEIVIGTPVPGVPVLDVRAQGIRDELGKRLPGVEVLGPFDTKADPLVNQSTWGTLVAANPAALAYLGTADQDAVSLAAIRQREKATWQAGAFDLDPKALAAVKSGDLVLVSPEHFVKGAIAGRLQAQHAKTGKKLPKGWIYTPGLAITPANIDEIVKRQESTAAKEAWFRPEIDKVLNDQRTYLRPMDEAR